MASNERFRLPPELEDDQQAAVLYSPFREKSVNPQSWNRKIKFWEKVLTDTAVQRKTVTFDVSRLPMLYERKGMTPKCLPTVIDALKKSGHIKTIDDYKRTYSWLSWGFSALVKQPLSWGVNQLFGSPKKEADIYVWPEVVKKLSEEVLELHQSTVHHELTDNVMSMAHLRALCQSLIPSDQDFDIVLTQLERDKKIAVTETEEKEVVVKICKKEESAVAPIKELELQIYRIQLAQRKLEEEIEVLSSREKGHINEAREHIREGRKTMAKHSLKKRKAILKAIDRKAGSLNTLHDIVQRIEEASTNDMVLKACEAGVAAMKTLNSSTTVEKAEAVMDEMQEAVENQDDINQVLSSPISDEDNDQLEKDLETLLNDSIRQEENDRKLDSSAISKEEEGKLEEELDALLNDGLKGGQPSNAGSDLQDAFASLAIDDIGFPNVPSHSPSESSHKGKKRVESSSKPLASSSFQAST